MLGLAVASIGLFLAVLVAPSIAIGQARPDPAVLVSAQQEAMTRFAMMDGVWRGPAWILLPSGEKHHLTQTERVGPFLDGSVKVIEGRGYEADGSVGFNALAVISFDPATETYSMRSYAQGHSGDFTIRPTDAGFEWEIPAGPMTIRYTAVFDEGTWTEIGDRLRPGEDPVRFYEMTLHRIADTSWPNGGAIAPE